LGNGDGSFGGPTNYFVDSPYTVSLGDLNGDGHLDIVAADVYDNADAVLLNNGDGSFSGPTYYAADNNFTYTFFATLADVNGDGTLDIVNDNFYGTFYGTAVTTLLGNGDGTFGSFTGSEVGMYSYGLTLADLNGDGKLDVVTADFYNFTISVGF